MTSNMIKNTLRAAALIGSVTLLGACSDDASIASRNLSKAADMFEINRRIVFINGITGQYMFTIEGRCSIKADSRDKQLEVTCKTGFDSFKKHFLGLSDNVSYIAEQMESKGVSVYHTRIIFKPQSIIPNVDFRGNVNELMPD